MHEHGSDDTARRDVTNHRPRRSVPHVHDANERPIANRSEGPFNIHSLRDPANVPESNGRRLRRTRSNDRHERLPPRWPVGRAEWPVRGHLHGAAAIRSTLGEADIAVMREVLRPALDIRGQREDHRERRMHEMLIDRRHPTIGRHGTERVRRTIHRRHAALDGRHDAVKRNPSRRRIVGVTPTALRTMLASSPRVKPRSTDTTPSCRVTA